MEDEVLMQDTNAIEDNETNIFDDDLFNDDAEVEETEQTSEEEETEAEAESTENEVAEEESEQTSEEETLELKFLGTTNKVSKKATESIGNALGKSGEEVVSLIQKGMNYDNTPLHKLMDTYADAYGLTREEFVKTLEDGAKGIFDKVARDRITNAHPDWDDEKIEMQIAIEKNERTKHKAEQEKATEFEANKPFLEFINKYPDVKEFPEAVANDINKGVHPIIAYESYLQQQMFEEKMAEITAQAEKEKRKQVNKNKSTGSLRSADDGEHDSFLDGFGKY